MKDLSGIATGVAQSPIDRCFARLSDMESYPGWYPEGVRQVVVLERDDLGVPRRVDATLTITHGVLRFDRAVPMSVALEHPGLIRLERVPDDTHDREQLQVIWRLRSLADQGTELSVEMRAQLALPPFVPGLGGLAEEVAGGFLRAAVRDLSG